MESLFWDDSLKKSLSTIYKALQPTVHHNLHKLKSSWLVELPELDGKDWEDIWEYPFSQLVSSKDRLIQFKIMHMLYLTPHRLQ